MCTCNQGREQVDFKKCKMLFPCTCVTLDCKAGSLSVANANGIVMFVFLAAGVMGDAGPSHPCLALWSQFGGPYIEGHRVE